MTICALLLARQFYDLQPSARLKYATLGLLFVNVSIGGTLTHFAAPPVLMVARPWGWDTPFMLGALRLAGGRWRSSLATLVYFLIFRRELRRAGRAARRAGRRASRGRRGRTGAAAGAGLDHGRARRASWRGPWSTRTTRRCFSAASCSSSASSRRRRRIRAASSCKTPLLVGFFLAGLVIHGGLQGWWIAPVLASLTETPLFLGATVLTAFNDNALITYLATLVPNLERRAEDRRRRGRGDRRRPDGDRQRAEPGRPGAARPLLRRRGLADRPPAGRAVPRRSSRSSPSVSCRFVKIRFRGTPRAPAASNRQEIDEHDAPFHFSRAAGSRDERCRSPQRAS